ncbi:MAG: hypothetical protein D6811_12690 [Alphaproteobacteria bacterium]|nr:MAG: hypothetical protein D6811_12690 [Alphaproteobacteria bacterium]
MTCVRRPGRHVFATAARGTRATCVRLGLVWLLAALPVQAAERLVVTDDPGGELPGRVAEIARLRAARTAVEIRGRFCLSACTLYLGLPDVCVSPRTQFGFHGPSSPIYGIALPPRQFEHWSRVMAAHYPPPLRQWFLREGRRVTMGFLRLSGSELIAMGIAACSDAAVAAPAVPAAGVPRARASAGAGRRTASPPWSPPPGSAPPS